MTDSDKITYISEQAKRHAAEFEKTSRQAEALKPGGGDGTSGGMDPWQTSVEKRLEGVIDLRERLARVETKIDHLPTKDWITARLQIYVGLMAGITVIATAIANFL